MTKTPKEEVQLQNNYEKLSLFIRLLDTKVRLILYQNVVGFVQNETQHYVELYVSKVKSNYTKKYSKESFEPTNSFS